MDVDTVDSGSAKKLPASQSLLLSWAKHWPEQGRRQFNKPRSRHCRDKESVIQITRRRRRSQVLRH